jgi:hypothetical protein
MPQPPALWLGHATTRITGVAGSAIVVDPFRTKNPRMPPEYRDLKAVGKVDLILVTHGQSGLIATDKGSMGSAWHHQWHGTSPQAASDRVVGRPNHIL